MRRSEGLANSSFSALAAADLITLANRDAAGEGKNRRTCRAFSTFLPFTNSTIGLSLSTEIPVFVEVALAANSVPLSAYLTLVIRSDLDEWPLKVLVGANSPSL